MTQGKEIWLTPVLDNLTPSLDEVHNAIAGGFDGAAESTSGTPTPT